MVSGQLSEACWRNWTLSFSILLYLRGAIWNSSQISLRSSPDSDSRMTLSLSPNSKCQRPTVEVQYLIMLRRADRVLVYFDTSILSSSEISDVFWSAVSICRIMRSCNVAMLFTFVVEENAWFSWNIMISDLLSEINLGCIYLSFTVNSAVFASLTTTKFGHDMPTVPWTVRDSWTRIERGFKWGPTVSTCDVDMSVYVSVSTFTFVPRFRQSTARNASMVRSSCFVLCSRIGDAPVSSKPPRDTRNGSSKHYKPAIKHF